MLTAKSASSTTSTTVRIYHHSPSKTLLSMRLIYTRSTVN